MVVVEVVVVVGVGVVVVEVVGLEGRRSSSEWWSMGVVVW